MNFEQLFNRFDENIIFICDKVYESDVKYILRYVFDEYEDIDIEVEESDTEEQNATTKPSKVVKKITDLDEDELKSFFLLLILGYTDMSVLKKNLKKL